MSNDWKRLEELEQQYRMQCGVIDTYEKECDMLRANLSKAMADMGEVIDEVKRLRAQRHTLLDITTPSGKNLYSCNSCGNVSPFPDKICPIESCKYHKPEEATNAKQTETETEKR